LITSEFLGTELPSHGWKSLPREVLRKGDRHRTSTKFRPRVIRRVHELCKRPTYFFSMFLSLFFSVSVGIKINVNKEYKEKQIRAHEEVDSWNFSFFEGLWQQL